MTSLRKMAATALVLGVVAVTTACQTTQKTIPEHQYMNAAEMMDFMNNKKYTGISQPDGIGFTAFIKNDGTIEGSAGIGVDTGVWRLDGNVVCMKWNTWRYAQEYCIRAVARADGRFQTYYLDGSTSSIFSPL